MILAAWDGSRWPASRMRRRWGRARGACRGARIGAGRGRRRPGGRERSPRPRGHLQHVDHVPAGEVTRGEIQGPLPAGRSPNGLPVVWARAWCPMLAACKLAALGFMDPACTVRVRSAPTRAFPEIVLRLARCAENQLPELDLDSSGGPQRRPASNDQPIGAAGFEPATSRSQSECATRLRHAPSTTSESTATPSAVDPSTPAVAPGTACRQRRR